ncbi:hypothetical protein [Actinomadura sp. 9N407]|uniref:hypothetical protein n=1 Tax=Actinomadura sp. 9N407 TaxID=3375154 RepID=UPI0037948900
MRCPGCGSDTTPSLPRCTRCNAPLGGVHGEEGTTPDPFAGSGPGPDSPVPPPWSSPPSDPPGWGTPPHGTPPHGTPPHGPPPGDSGERTISLSEEPWEHEKWAEEVWAPGPTPKKQALPYILAGGGVVLLMAIALAIIFWPSSQQSGTSAANTPTAGAGESPGSESAGDPSATDSGAGLNKQAGQVDALLTEMSSTRTELGSVVTGGCAISDMERVRDQRKEQLDKARALEVDAMENGTEMRSALVRALTASVESNQRYVDIGPGCPSDDTVQPINERASQAKREFIDYWRPNAEKAGLAVRNADTI